MIKRLPWLRNLKKTDPEPPVRLPAAVGAVSNGEGWWPDSARKKLIRKLVLEKADEVSRREGCDRREFLASACGMATTLYMINVVNGCATGKDKKPIDNMLGPGAGSNGGGSGSGANAGNGPGGGGSTSTGGGGTNSMGGAGMNSGMSGSSADDAGFMVPADAMTNEEVAICALGDGGNELIIDMQSHFASPETNPLGALGLQGFIGQITQERFPWIMRPMGCDPLAVTVNCFDRAAYVELILNGSDTTIGVLSGISYALGDDGTGYNSFAALSNEDLIDGVNYLSGMFPGRMLSHAMVMPNDRLQTQLAMMERTAGTYTNWKTYPPWSPGGDGGYWLDQGEGPTMIQKGIDLGSPIFCIHKGFPLTTFNPVYTNPKDVGPAANMFPDAHFVIYHSAFEHGLAPGQSTAADDMTTDVGWGPGVGMYPEGPFDENDAAIQEKYPLDRGVNSLITSLRSAGIGPNGTRLNNDGGPVTNVYAECGGVWPNLMTGRVEESMHYWGKLLKHIGEDRIVWGTDCMWFGSPQPVIQAFRAFSISQEFQDKYGYPALTQARKEKILGQNAARLQNIRLAKLGSQPIMGCHSDYVSQANLRLKRDLDGEFGKRRDMIANVWGPKTRREFLKLRNDEHREKLVWSGNFPSKG